MLALAYQRTQTVVYDFFSPFFMNGLAVFPPSVFPHGIEFHFIEKNKGGHDGWGEGQREEGQATGGVG